MEKTCPHCGKKFLPHPAVVNQRYCGSADCQKAGKRKWQKERLKNGPDYRDAPHQISAFEMDALAARQIMVGITVMAARLARAVPARDKRHDGNMKIMAAEGRLIVFAVRILGKVIDQTERHVFKGEKVPASEKIVSFFEDHTDIIVKGRRDTEYGHKVFLSGGASTMILGCLIVRGNPADSDRCQSLLSAQGMVRQDAPRGHG